MGAIITVGLVVTFILLDLYLRHFAPSETVIAKIISKRDQGTVGRKAFLVTLRTPKKQVECVTTKANWDKARSGEFANVTVAWKHRFIQRFEPLRLKPEEKIRLQKTLDLRD